MQYAVREVGGKWERETAEHILKYREKYGTDSQEYKNIKDTFYCYGCYLNWKELYEKEPTKKDIPLLNHFNMSRTGGTHFRIRGSAKNRGKNDHGQGCRFKDPVGYLKRVSGNFKFMDVDPKGIINVSILKKKQKKSKKNNRFVADNPGHIGIQRTQTFGALQEIYNCFGEAWIELAIRTEDNKNVKVKDLMFASFQALEESQNHEGKIHIITGKVTKVESRNKGGYINIIFKKEKKLSSPPFTLSVSPNYIYNEDDLKCLENRQIGCYGRVSYNKNFIQMELFSLQNQIVFLDLKEGERCPFTVPSINYERLKMVIDECLESYGAVTSAANDKKFLYYLEKKEDIPLLKEKIKQTIVERDGLAQEKKYRKEEKEKSIIKKEMLIKQLNNKKNDLVSIRSSLEEQNSIMQRLFKIIRRSEEIKLLRSKETIIEKEVMNIKQDYYYISNEIVEIENSIKHVDISNLNLQEKVDETLGEINSIERGFNIEETWREHLKREPGYMYHNTSKNYWISVNFTKSVSNSEIVQVTCVFQLHDKEHSFRISPQTAEIIKFYLRPNDEIVYETARIELVRSLKRLNFSSKKKLIYQS